MNRKKPVILFVFHGTNAKNGAVRSLIDILDGLIDKDEYVIKAIFPTNTGSAIDHLRSRGVDDIRFYRYGDLLQDLTQPRIKRMLKMPLLLLRYIRMRRNVIKAYNTIKDEKIDLVYSNTSVIVFGGYLGLKLKCKQLWHIREFRQNDHRIKFFLGEKWLKTFINKCADGVMYVSQSVMNYNTDIIDKNKSVVTYNSYDKKFINPKEIIGSRKELVLLVAGDIKPSKGQREIVEATNKFLKKYPKESIKLLLAGKESNKPYCESIKKFIQKEKIENSINFLGHIDNMNELRKGVDIGIVPSENEAFGRTTIEGMLSMMAMIGRNSGGTVEQIEHEKTGLLYNGTIDDLERQIERLFFDRELLLSIAQNGYYDAVEKYTNGACVAIVNKTIHDVLNTPMSEVEN